MEARYQILFEIQAFHDCRPCKSKASEGRELQVSGYFRGGSQETKDGNKYLTERNAERLADALCRMRGAALKLGQLISIQDENVLPPQVTQTQYKYVHGQLVYS